MREETWTWAENFEAFHAKRKINISEGNYVSNVSIIDVQFSVRRAKEAKATNQRLVGDMEAGIMFLMI